MSDYAYADADTRSDACDRLQSTKSRQVLSNTRNTKLQQGLMHKENSLAGHSCIASESSHTIPYTALLNG